MKTGLYHHSVPPAETRYSSDYPLDAGGLQVPQGFTCGQSTGVPCERIGGAPPTLTLRDVRGRTGLRHLDG